MAFQRKKPAAIGIKATYPSFIQPALATAIDKVPSGERWLHEIKFDGYRVQIHLRDAAITAPGAAMTGPNASRKSRMTRGTSMPGRRSSTARWWCRPPMAPPIFRSYKTN
jgi:bifunctional non-homologous end joining protein LigD